MSTTVLRAAAFIDTLGVNTHIPYTDGGYVNIGNVTAELSYLGIHQVRDQISNGAAGSAPLSSYITVAQTGVHFTINISGPTTAALQSTLALADQLNAAVPGSVIAIEGPNEINNWPVTFNGVGGLQGAINMQAEIYSLVHADPNLTGVAVDYFTGYGNGGLAMGPNPATTPGLADYDTQHPYPNNGQAPYVWVNRTQALPNENPPTGPAVYTETGYSTNGGTSGAVNQDVQAKYTLDLLMDDAKSGIAHTDLYQLMDAYAPGSPQGDDGFGLFGNNNQPKEAATAIHDLTTILADAGATAGSFPTTAAAYSIAGLPATGNSMEIEKSSGASDIVVWNEPAIWNESNGTEISAATQPVTVNLGATYQTVNVFDPLSGTTPIETLSNVSSLSLGLTDHPLIIETEPQSTTTGGSSGSDTLTLNMSEDSWKGDARFTVKVNGQQVGGTDSAAVLHASGDAGSFLLTGNWGAGAKDVTISFINDAYGGSASTDRNLYVNSIEDNGVAYANTSASLFTNGTASFVVGGSAPTQAAPADTLTLTLSEDAYKGNADFVLYIDGKAVTSAQVVSALKDAGSTQTFTLTGNLGAARHTIGVAFINDAYGGSASADRNLYVDGVTMNGANVFSGVRELPSNGTANFAVTTSS